MADLLKDLGKVGSVFGKVSEVVGELGGWMSILGIGKRSAHVNPAGESRQEAGLKASFMGAGENDEALFWSAVALAQKNDWIDEIGLANVSVIFSKLNYEEKNRLYKIIGRDEQSVVIEVHSKTTSAKPAQAQSTRRRSPQGGKEKVEKTSTTGNIRGAMTIALLASMDPDNAVAFLRNSGTLTGVTDDIEHLYGKLSVFLKNTEAGKRVQKGLRKAVLDYLGANTLRGAEAQVSAKELALAHRQAQPWYERIQQKQSVLFMVWCGLVIFSVAALIYVYVFTH